MTTAVRTRGTHGSARAGAGVASAPGVRTRRGRVHSERGRRIAAPQVATTDQGLFSRIPFVVLVLVLLGAGIALTLVLWGKATTTELRIAELGRQNVALREQRESLARDVERAESPAQLARAAARLGLVPVIESAIVSVGPDGATAVHGAPKPADGEPLGELDGSPLGPPPPSTDPADTRRPADPSVIPMPGGLPPFPATAAQPTVTRGDSDTPETGSPVGPAPGAHSEVEGSPEDGGIRR